MKILSAGIVREIVFDDEEEEAKYLESLKKCGKEGQNYLIFTADDCKLKFKDDEKLYPYLVYIKQDGKYELCQELQERDG